MPQAILLADVSRGEEIHRGSPALAWPFPSCLSGLVQVRWQKTAGRASQNPDSSPTFQKPNTSRPKPLRNSRLQNAFPQPPPVRRQLGSFLPLMFLEIRSQSASHAKGPSGRPPHPPSVIAEPPTEAAPERPRSELLLSRQPYQARKADLQLGISPRATVFKPLRLQSINLDQNLDLPPEVRIGVGGFSERGSLKPPNLTDGRAHYGPRKADQHVISRLASAGQRQQFEGETQDELSRQVATPYVRWFKAYCKGLVIADDERHFSHY